MKLNKQIVGLTALAVLSGCSEEQFVSSEGTEKVEITAIADGHLGTATSRSIVGGIAGDGSLVMQWLPADKIGVFGSNTKNACFASTNTDPQNKTSFTGAMTGGETPVYAYYPYNKDVTDATAIPVRIPAEQDYLDEQSVAQFDYKASTQAVKDGDGYRMNFRQLASLLRLQVNLNGSEGLLEDEKLLRVEMTITDGAALTGSFTSDLPGGGALVPASECTATLAVVMSRQPVITERLTAYAVIAPGAQKGKTAEFVIFTNKHKATFSTQLQTDFVAGTFYDLPLNATILSDHQATVEDYTPEGGQLAAGALQNFSFKIAANKGKLLENEAYYNGSATTTRRVTSDKTMTVTEGADKGEVNGCIPYLYDFVLKPTFTVTSGMDVYVNGTKQVSGVSEQDFSHPVTYTVKDADGNSRDYVVTLTNTGLPVVVLTSDGTGGMKFLHTYIPLKDDDFVETHKIAIYDVQHPENNLPEAACGFRLRGNSTSNFPKKPLAVKLVTKASVLGMPKHKRWCLLASWIDRSLIRNGVAFDIANKATDTFAATENKGIGWNPHGQNVELVLNGVHVGSYYLCEQIKIDKNRIAIQDGFEDQTAPTTDNCGYLLEFDDNFDEPNKMHTSHCNLPLMSKDNITNSTIWNYISGWVQDIENKLWNGNYTAAYEKLDINSVADYWIVQELTMNNEYRHPKSVYMVKDGAGKLCAGPVWDFDYQTFPNIAEINKINKGYGKPSVGFDINTELDTKCSYSGGYDGDAPYMWYPLLMKDPNFKARVKQRWTTLYPVLQGVTATIDRLGSECKLSDKYNQQIWPIESKERTGYSWYIDYSGDERMEYDALIENFKTVYLARLNAMNSFISKW